MYTLPDLNNAPSISHGGIVANTSLPNQPVYTELAQSFMPFMGRTSLSTIFPEETILERMVICDQIFESVPTIFPLVQPGKPDLFVDYEGNIVQRKYYAPINIRQSISFCHAEINNRVKPGTMNQRWSPQEQIAEKVAKAVESHNLTWDVYRAMMLNGGISYTDPRTGVAVQAPAMIPAHNYFSYNNLKGWNGRNEANLFRSLVDSNAAEPATAGVSFADPSAAIIDMIRKFKRWFEDTNKCPVTAMYVHKDLKEVIIMNNEMKLAQGGIVPRIGAVTGDRQIIDNTGAGGGVFVSPGLAAQAVGDMVRIIDGEVVSIAGVEIRELDTVFKDPVDGAVKRVMPLNQIIMVSEVDRNGNAQAPGRTQYCISEEAGGAPGLWTRTEEETRIPAAPGMAMQMGNAGLPYLKYPHKVAKIKVAEVSEIKSRLGILGDLNYGTF